MYTPVEETGTNILMKGIPTYSFDNARYSLMFLTNAIYNDMTTAEHRSRSTFSRSNIHDTIIGQAKGSINKIWKIIYDQSTLHVIFNPKLLNNFRNIYQMIYKSCYEGVNATDRVGEIP